MIETVSHSIRNWLNPRGIYLSTISLLGIVLLVIGIFHIPQDNLLLFSLLLLLAIAAQFTATSLASGDVTVDVSTAIGLATVALYGPYAACVVASASAATSSMLSLRTSWPGWARTIERIAFNVGMVSVAMFIAGLVFEGINLWLDSIAVVSEVAAWLIAAVINDQANLWILIGLLHLQIGLNPIEIWSDHKWAIPINVLVTSVGGFVLAFAVREFNVLGALIFFLPILMSAYSFRLYVTQSKRQQQELEELVELRTADLAKANKELEEVNKDKDAFLAVLTHDMRTPLTSIKGYASVLRDREVTLEQQQHIAKIILRSQDSLLEIVNNILEIEKLQSGTPVLLEYSSFDLALLTKGSAELLEAQALDKELTFEYDRVPTPVIIEADMSKIERVITNLISNAVKYTPRGGSVKVMTKVNGRYAFVSVNDTGYGIPADELPYIFDRYSRVRGHQNLAVGTGLGLAIVKSLVEAHDGAIDVESEVDVGSTFTLKLPLS